MEKIPNNININKQFKKLSWDTKSDEKIIHKRVQVKNEIK